MLPIGFGTRGGKPYHQLIKIAESLLLQKLSSVDFELTVAINLIFV